SGRLWRARYWRTLRRPGTRHGRFPPIRRTHEAASGWTEVYAGHGPGSVSSVPAAAPWVARRFAADLNCERRDAGTRNAASISGGVDAPSGMSLRLLTSHASVARASYAATALSA